MEEPFVGRKEEKKHFMSLIHENLLLSMVPGTYLARAWHHRNLHQLGKIFE